MGSPLRLAIHFPKASEQPHDREAGAAWRAVLAEFAACDETMSRFRDDSEITSVNRSAGTSRPVRVSSRLRRALAAADRARRLTDGRFDASVLADLDRLGYRGAPLGAVDPRSAPTRTVDLGTDGVRLDRPVDLGGIGKGLALRWAADRVRDLHPDASFLVEAGGDIVARGGAPEGGAWIVGIEDPLGGGAPLAAIACTDAAVATSSVRVNRWRSGDRIVHHLVDPATGEPGRTGLLAVTTVDADPAWAEVRAKELFLAGADGIGSLARGLGLAAWWVRDDGRLEMTPAARQQTVWVGAAR
jgi:thiamine biosynthesis lipoprotein